MLTAEQFTHFLRLTDDADYKEIKRLVMANGSHAKYRDYYGFYDFDLAGALCYVIISPSSVDEFIKASKNGHLDKFIAYNLARINMGFEPNMLVQAKYLGDDELYDYIKKMRKPKEYRKLFN